MSQPYELDFEDYVAERGGSYLPFPAAVELVYFWEWARAMWTALRAGHRPPAHRVAFLLSYQPQTKPYLPQWIAEEKNMKITITTSHRSFTANFVRSEDCGYRPGKLLLDLPGSARHISVYRYRNKWIEALVEENVCRRSTEHKTRAAALNSAAEEYAARALEIAKRLSHKRI